MGFWEELDTDKTKFFLRVIQAILAFLCLCLSASVVARLNGVLGSTYASSPHGFLVFTALVAMLLAILFAIGPILHNQYGIHGVKHILDMRVEIVVTFVLCIFWLAAFIATAVQFFSVEYLLIHFYED